MVRTLFTVCIISEKKFTVATGSFLGFLQKNQMRRKKMTNQRQKIKILGGNQKTPKRICQEVL